MLVVTGATGQLGRLVVEDLLERGVTPADITATGRDLARLEPLAERGVRTAVLDYDAPEASADILTGADVLLLVSSTETGPKRVRQHSAVIEVAKDSGTGRIVYTSAPHADIAKLVPAPDHKATEEFLRASGVSYTITRINWYTENYAYTFEQSKTSGEVLSSAGAGRVASAPRADYAAGIAAVMLDPATTGKTLELSGDVAWAFDDLAAVFTEVLGRPVAVRQLDREAHLSVLKEAGFDDTMAAALAELDANIRDGALADATSTLRALIGRPTQSLLQTVRSWD
ncbi:SDR family oxidoreductase [Streptomyces sp. NPDC090088]|uniref:SDR family oxidoreductase n=1 Tax=Streptomyces sp. NPDC090088 TaxID=3365944 RepID=UPI0037FF1B7C